VIKKLKEVMPIKRTKMLLRIHFNPESELCAHCILTSYSIAFPPDRLHSMCVLTSHLVLFSHFAGETNIRLRLNKEGAAILTTSVVGAVVETTEDTINTPTFAHRPQQSSLDFEIEPEAYRGVEALVKSLAAG